MEKKKRKKQLKQHKKNIKTNRGTKLESKSSEVFDATKSSQESPNESMPNKDIGVQPKAKKRKEQIIKSNVNEKENAKVEEIEQKIEQQDEKVISDVEKKKQNKIARRKKYKTFYAILGMISDTILIPVIIISLLSSFVMFINQRKNQVELFFGFGLACIQSESMLAAGFKRFDTVILKKIGINDIRPREFDGEGEIVDGTILAFYYIQEGIDVDYVGSSGSPKSSLKLVSTEEELKTDYHKKYNDLTEDQKQIVDERKTRKEIVADDKNVQVYFHRVDAIYVDDTGTKFFRTWGDSNASADSKFIREDFVVGEYAETPLWLRGVFKFCASTEGMILLVVLPLTALIFMQMLSLLEQISALIVEKKVIARILAYNSSESIKANVGMEMREFDKSYMYDTTPEEGKEEIANFLWYYINGVVPKKFLKKQQMVLNAISIYKLAGRDDYWEHCQNIARLKLTRKRIKKAQLTANLVLGGEKYEIAVKKAKELYKKNKKLKGEAWKQFVKKIPQ